MCVLVTGGAGYIGSHMVLRLLDAGEEVVVIDDLSSGQRDLVPEDANLIVGNLGDLDLVRSVIRNHDVEDILHFAGSVIVPESVADPLKYYLNNTAVSRGLIDLALAEDVLHFLFSSTAQVYGSFDGPVPETAHTVPLSPYGNSKLMTELILRDVAAVSNLRYGVLRYFNVVGADPAGRSGHGAAGTKHIIRIACRAALGQLDYVEVFGTDYETEDGTGVRDYIHVSDLVDAHALVLDHLRAGGDSVTLNCGYGRGHSVRQVIDKVKEVSGVDFEVRDAPRRDGDPASVVADADKLRATLPWSPKHDDLHGIVESTFAWEARQSGH